MGDSPVNSIAGSKRVAYSSERDSRFQVVAVPPVADVVSVAALRKPDVAVISADFISSARKGLQIAHSLSLRLPRARIVILLDTLGRESVVGSFRSGATGVFCRTDPIADFRTCVAQVSGEKYGPETSQLSTC